MAFDYQLHNKTVTPDADFSHLREAAPYLTPPRAMYVGAPGKQGYLRMGFQLDASGKSIMRDWERRAPIIVQQELYFDEAMPEMPCVYILSSGGQNVDGDRYRQEITMQEGSFAWVSTGAATKIGEMYDNYSGMVQKLRLDRDSYLEFMPEPVIPCRHARFICDTEIEIDATATLFYSEIYMAGRKYYKEGEMYEYDMISVTSHAHRPEGEMLFREKFIIRPEIFSPRTLGAMGEYDVFANVIVLTPPEKGEEIFEKTEAFIDRKNRIAAGITRLPNNAGLLYKVVGMEPGPVKKMVREFCSTVRMAVKGRPVPPEFPWR